MARGSNQKLKLFYLLDIMRRKTDLEHELQLPEIAKELEACDVACERKTFYTDFDELRKYGYDIQGRKKGNYFYYHLGKREFDLLSLGDDVKIIGPEDVEKEIKQKAKAIAKLYK